jgi:uncharacterized protein (UPF0332 family)
LSFAENLGILKAMNAKSDDLNEIKLYLDAAHESLAAAKLNLENDFYSAAANRIYYAVFYAATALLKTKALSFSKHSAVLSAFRQQFIKTGEFSPEMGDFFRDAFDMRQAGDYEMLTRFEPNDLSQQLASAHQFIDEIEQWLQKHKFLPS